MNAKTRAAENIKTMSANIEKFKAELDAKNAELDQLNADILAAATTEYTPSQTDVKQEELSAKQAALATAQAKQAELTAAIGALTTKISSSEAKLKQLEGRIPAAKAAKAADGGKAFQAILAEQKTTKAQKAADEQTLSNTKLQLDLATSQAQQLQDAIAILQNDISAIPPAAPSTDPTAGESLADKLARLPKLKARITKVKASQDPKGKLQTSLEQAKAQLRELEVQGAAKDDEIRTFKEKLVAQRAAGGKMATPAITTSVPGMVITPPLTTPITAPSA